MREFLKHFGLNEITDLPRPREIEEILGESQFETERRMLEAQEGADQSKKEEEDFKSRLPHIPRKKSEFNEEVQIIPKARARKLNLRAKEDEPSSTPLPPAEVPAQVDVEKPKFDVPRQESEPESGESEAAAHEKAELNLISGPVTPETNMPPPAGDSTPEDSSDVPDTVPVVPVEDHSSRDELPAARKDSSYPTIPQNEPEMTQPRRSPWTSWKARIQTFIRKLFG
jgi:hypothetical protein